MLKITPVIDKKFILTRLSQEEIFERYLGLKVSFTEKVCSPLREDSTPTCTFKRFPSGVIIFKDWAGHFRGDCFEVVKHLYNCNFPQACEQIARDFDLADNGLPGKNIDKKPKKYEHKEKETKDIKVKWRSFNDADIHYWSSHGISFETLRRYNVAPFMFAWVGESMCYSYRPSDPGYAYAFGEGRFKLYFPRRKEWRFLGNFKGLQGYDQLPETGILLVITKSLKDVMFLYEMGIPAVAPPSESSILSEEQYEDLSNRFDNLVSMYDFDLTGLRSANKMHRLYDIPRVFLTNGRFGTKDYGGKDPTDIVKFKGINVAKQTVKDLLGW